jgi:hypothetical protein
MSTDKAPIGIDCAVTYHDSPDGYEDAYISFSEELLNHEGEPAEEDIYGVPDDRIFFYFNAEQQEALGVAIAEDKDKFHLGEEWYIDLTEGYALVYE